MPLPCCKPKSEPAEHNICKLRIPWRYIQHLLPCKLIQQAINGNAPVLHLVTFKIIANLHHGHAVHQTISITYTMQFTNFTTHKSKHIHHMSKSISGQCNSASQPREQHVIQCSQYTHR